MADLAQQPQNNFFKKPLVLFLLAVLCCALWGSAFPVIKIGYNVWNIENGDYASQILFAGVRFALAGILIFIFSGIISRKPVLPKKDSAGKIAVLALFQTVFQYLFFYIGLARTSGSKSSILDSTSVFFSVIIVTLIMKTERFTVLKAIGCIIGFSGVVLINIGGNSFDSGFSFFGEGFILLSALSYALSSVFIKKYSQTESPVALSASQFLLGGIVMIISGLLLKGSLGGASLKGIFIVIYLAFLSAFAYTVWSLLLKYNNVSSVTVYSFMIPVFGCLLSALILKERLGTSFAATLLSLILVSLGIFLVNKKEKSSYGEKYES